MAERASRRAGLLIGVALLACESAAVADSLPFEGKWAKQGETCVAGQPAPLVLTAKRLEARTVMTCDFTSVLPGGISFRVEADCEANGQKGHEFFTFAVLSGRLYWSWGGQTGGFDRCQD